MNTHFKVFIYIVASVIHPIYKLIWALSRVCKCDALVLLMLSTSRKDHKQKINVSSKLSSCFTNVISRQPFCNLV